MKQLCFTFPFLLWLLIPMFLHAQSLYLKEVSAFDNNYDNSSGIIAISDTAVYQYSWYYETWLPFADSGLVKHEDIPVVTDVAAFDNDSHNPSGIYVISDTVVCVYNYYSGKWHSLNNEGLARIDGIVQLSSISAYKEADSEDVKLHAVSDTSVYRYSWYHQAWFRFPNSGVLTKLQGDDLSFQTGMANYPNPFSARTTITYTLPEQYNSNVRIALFDQNGKFVREILNKKQAGGQHRIKLDACDLPAGVYYYEICGDGFSQAKKAVCIK